MTYLLDANTCINYLNGRSEPIRRQVESLRPDNIALCSVVKAELLYGAAKSGKSAENVAKLRRFFARFASLPFDDTSAEVYGRIRARLERAGSPIGPNDLLIAAIALAHQRTLVTHNLDEFRRIEELEIEDWE